jgi:hypothetical protein
MRVDNIIVFSTPEFDRVVTVSRADDGTGMFLTQRAMANLFNVNVQDISKHLENIFDSGELDIDSVVFIEEKPYFSKIYGKKVEDKNQYYNLDAILAVGYRINSYQATQFRIWATKTLKELILNPTSSEVNEFNFLHIFK